MSESHVQLKFPRGGVRGNALLSDTEMQHG